MLARPYQRDDPYVLKISMSVLNSKKLMSRQISSGQTQYTTKKASDDCFLTMSISFITITPFVFILISTTLVFSSMNVSCGISEEFSYLLNSEGAYCFATVLSSVGSYFRHFVRPLQYVNKIIPENFFYSLDTRMFSF